jgi:hypothetical protein
MVPYIPDQQINTGLFIPTTNNWDVENIKELDTNSEEFKELFVRLYQNINNISVALNAKDSAFYLLEEFNTGQLYFNPTTAGHDSLRPVFRKVINLSPLVPGVNNFAHGLTIAPTWKFTKIAGVATSTNVVASYYPLPFIGTGLSRIVVYSDNANIVVNNTTGITFPNAYVVLEYVKF